MRNWIFLFFVNIGFILPMLGADIRVYIKNNEAGTQISDVVILGRKNRGSGEWTTVWGGQKSSRNAKDETFGFGELRRYVFKDSEMSEYQVRYVVKLGELNLVEDYWTGTLLDGSILVMECPKGRCSLMLGEKLVPKHE